MHNKQNTPGIIKYPFWQMTYENPRAVYACVKSIVVEDIKKEIIAFANCEGESCTSVFRMMEQCQDKNEKLAK